MATTPDSDEAKVANHTLAFLPRGCSIRGCLAPESYLASQDLAQLLDVGALGVV